MNRRNGSFEIRGIACLIFAVCGLLLNVFSVQAITTKAVNPKASLLVPREVRVVTQNASAGQTITVVLEADTMGDESIYGFTLNYSTNILTYVPNSVAIGSGATRQAGGLCNVLENADVAGRIGFSIDCGNSTITAGNNRRFVTLQFTVASTAPFGSSPLTFNDTPAQRRVSSNPQAGAIMDLPTTFANGFINISSPTAALIEISGRVALPRGRGLNNAIVRLATNNETLTTRTNAFGYYRFKVRAGEICVLSVSHKRYQFASQVVTVLDAMSNLDFTAEP